LVSGGTVIRAVIQADGVTVGVAQCVVRRFGNFGGVALCTRGPLWLTPLSGKDKAHAYRSLRQTLPVKGLRFLFVTPNEPGSDDLGLSPLKRVMTGYSTALLDLTPSLADLRAGLEKRFRHRVGGAEKSELTVHRVGTNVGQYRWLMDAEKLQLLHTGALGSGPRPLLDSPLPPRKTLTIVDVDLAQSLTRYTTYDMKTEQVVDIQSLPRVINSPTGKIWRRDIEETQN